MTAALPVLINRSGGTAAGFGDSLADVVTQAFADAGRTIVLELVEPGDLPEALRRHAGAPVIAVGGGDGTIGTAAAILANSMTALAILPLGTRNHLARQIGVPLDLPAAARLAVSGQRRRIDLGRAGDRVFVNNASFGIYSRFVRDRDAGNKRTFRATIGAACKTLRNMRARHFELRIDGKRVNLATPLLFIGNNEYSLSIGQLGTRETLTEHRLAMLALPDAGPVRMTALALRTLFGVRAAEQEYLEFGLASEVVIEGTGLIEGAFDGEALFLPLPLKLRTLPNALGVVSPRVTVLTERMLTQTV